VLICIGTEYHVVSRDESAEIAELLHHGSWRVIEGFKHPLEAVDKYLLVEICVTKFLLED
jgi:hypothetical protein